MVAYTYSISTDFLLVDDIELAAVVTAINNDGGITQPIVIGRRTGDSITIIYNSALSGPELDTLNNIIATYIIPAGGNAVEISTITNNNVLLSLPESSGTLVSADSTAVLTNKLWGDDLDMNNHKVINLSTPTNGNDAVNKNYVDTMGMVGYEYVESLSLNSTTSIDYITKVRLTTSSLMEGYYRVGWSYDWQYSRRRFNGRIYLDDSVVISMHVDETSNNKDVPRIHAKFIRIYMLSGTHTIDIDYCCDVLSGGSVSISNANIELWKVS